MRIRLWLTVLITAVSAAIPAAACTFCAGALISRKPLSHYFAESTLVVHGKLRNARPAADGVGGTTELHVERVLKANAVLAGTKLVVVPRYIPLIGDTPSEYVLFCAVADGKLEPTHGVPAGPTTAEYLIEASLVDRTDPSKSLGFFFKQLDAADSSVSADAFLEFARASDRDIQKAAGSLDRGKLRAWLADPKTPEERLGVYGMMLGLCGTRDDAAWLAGELGRQPMPDRYSASLGGLTAGLTLLDPKSGWSVIESVLTTPGRTFTDKLSVIGTLRYLQATRWDESKSRLLQCYSALIRSGDFADLAVDDLRRWGCWDLTATILAQFDQPTHKAPVIRRGIVRYALACPDAAAKTFLARVRNQDPAIVSKVEDSIKAFDLIPGGKK